jgi:putative transcriptional regulator
MGESYPKSRIYIFNREILNMVKNRLKQIRHSLQIDSKSEMARLLGLPPEQYNRYENQKLQPRLEVALKIAKRLCLTVEDIFYLSE